MSMIKSTSFTVSCDGCGKWYEDSLTYFHPTLTDARKAAKLDGWRRTKSGKDYCEFCKRDASWLH